MAVDKIISEWKKGQFKPVYWLEGEEVYYIDKALDYAEKNILSESEASFNLSIFYGRDSNWVDIVNACRRYPMFAERQVVLLKEGQFMRDIDKLEGYVEKPSPTTIFIVAYKDKKVDGRTKFSKVLKENGVMITTKKIADYKLPDWVQEMVESKGYSISSKALVMMVDHIGNDLARLENEIDKISINLGKRKSITEEDVENFVGISKEFNVFELQNAIGNKDLPKAIRIVEYFGANPKAAPIQLILPSLYSFFSKLFMLHGAWGGDEKSMAAATGIPPFFMKDYLKAAKFYDYAATEKVLLLLHQYNLRSIGIGDAGTEDASLLKEMIVKMVN